MQTKSIFLQSSHFWYQQKYQLNELNTIIKQQLKKDFGHCFGLSSYLKRTPLYLGYTN